MNDDVLMQLLQCFTDHGYSVTHSERHGWGQVSIIDPRGYAENAFGYEPTSCGCRRMLDLLLDHYAGSGAVRTFVGRPLAAIGPAAAGGPLASATAG